METKEKRTYKKPEPLDPNKTYKCSKCGAYLPLKNVSCLCRWN